MTPWDWGVLLLVIGIPAVFFAALLTQLEWAIDRPLYCTTCGKRLVTKERMTGYDRRTGKPVTTRDLWCPDAQRMNPMTGFPSTCSGDAPSRGDTVRRS